MRALACVLLGALLGLPSGARAEASGRGACLKALSRLGVSHRAFEGKRKPRGIDIPVEVRGRIGGVEFRPYRQKRLVIDCSLAVSLARAAAFFNETGITTVVYSSAYDRRKIRGTNRWSRHSYGLAIDVHTFSGPEIGEITVKDDYEQGLGDDERCLGDPLTGAGEILRRLHCHLSQSGLFRIVLTPDYDAHHYNHFHLEARPWRERRASPGG